MFRYKSDFSEKLDFIWIGFEDCYFLTIQKSNGLFLIVNALKPELLAGPTLIKVISSLILNAVLSETLL